MSLSQYVPKFGEAKMILGWTHKRIFSSYRDAGGEREQESVGNWVRGTHDPQDADDYFIMFKLFNDALVDSGRERMFPELVLVDSGSLPVGRGGVEPPTYWLGNAA